MEDEAIDPRADLMQGIQALQGARPDYDQAATYYEGKVPEVFTSIRIRRALARFDIDFDLNFARTPVNAVTNRLSVASITSPDEAVNMLISKVWQDNQLNLELPDLFRRAGEFGDAYLMVQPVEDDNGTVVRVEMYYNSPQTVRVIYDEEQPRRKKYTVKSWTDGAYLRAELLYDARTERWTTAKDSRGDRAQDWLHWPSDPEDPESWLIPNEAGQQPVFHFRNDRPYGCPEHYGAYGPQNAINKLQQTHMGTIDYQGFPQRYALTETANTDTSDLDPGDFDDGIWPFPEQGLGPSDSGDDSSLKAGPGEMMLLRGFKSVGQFDAAQPNVFLDPINFQIRAMAQITDTPLRMFDPQSHQRSGESIKEEDGPYIAKIENRQTSYGAALHEAFCFALRLLGVEDPVVSVDWVPAKSVTDVQGWQIVTAKINAGVPRKQALTEAGYRPEQVDAWLAGVDDAEIQRRVAILANLAVAAQAFGSAATLGAVSTEQVQGLLSGALSDLEVLAQAQGEG